MDLSSSLGLVAVVVLVLANGFFVATEFAIVAVRRSRLEQLAAEGHRSAKAAKEVVGHLDAYIAACQLGITMASLALGWLGEPAFAHLVEPPVGHEMVHSVEELRLLVTASQHAGAVEGSEARIATRAFEFADVPAGA